MMPRSLHMSKRRRWLPGQEAHGPVAFVLAVDFSGALQDALDPEKASGRPVTLAQMPPEKQAEMVRLYGAGPTKKQWE